ncbi:hypothetical protein QN362_00650 [Actimicrobium sp. CCC2.4]|uniref:hypothetical protein n=1 Tax=Actimicrobium sp. CCC2.4 TaxID=3048606 RepID=UPI002AC96176|nr:hypothetical protein [Actimicrobium sp. CCC2.4]MEB0133833.1 hypothetical protein [Actimicrobium sp. CCC2.4]WPX31375.1 hypothetical protein RHM62_14130 [Actimicrobium sp. CCC2.4]
MPQQTFEERLKNFNIDPASIKLTDLDVATNQTMLLTTTDSAYQDSVAFLEPQSITDLKRWIGIPDQAFSPGHPPPSIGPVVIHPTIRPSPASRMRIVIPALPAFHPEQIVTLKNLARDFIYGHSEHISTTQLPALNKWLDLQKIRMPMFVFRDIHVASGAVLNVKGKILFANHITIDKGGLIKLGNQSAIHAAGIQGL